MDYDDDWYPTLYAELQAPFFANEDNKTVCCCCSLVSPSHTHPSHPATCTCVWSQGKGSTKTKSGKGSASPDTVARTQQGSAAHRLATARAREEATKQRRRAEGLYDEVTDLQNELNASKAEQRKTVSCVLWLTDRCMCTNDSLRVVCVDRAGEAAPCCRGGCEAGDSFWGCRR